MKSGSFTNRLLLGAILTGLLHVCFCPGRTSANSLGEELDHPTKAAVDPYWKYYEDCDRWGIEFGQFKPSSGLELRPESGDELLKQQASRLQRTSPFQTVKHVIPKRHAPIVKISMIAKLNSACLQVRSLASKNFDQLVLPKLQYLEFVTVESTNYPEFFLNEKRSTAQERLKQVWGLIMAGTGVGQFRNEWLAKQGLQIEASEFVLEKMKQLINRVLQKNTGLFSQLSNPLNN